MPSSYYLLNNEIRFSIEVSPKSLSYQDKEVNLPPKEAQTLQFALDNRDRMIKADEIAIHLWGEDAVNADYANKKSQAINHVSKIRRRLEQLGYRKDWLQTEEHQGYKITCSVKYISGEMLRQRTIERKVRKEIREHRINMFKYGGSSAFVTILFFFIIYMMFTKSSLSIANVSQLPPLSGVSIEPQFSPDGQAIAFSYETESGQAKIYLKVESDINYRALTSGGFDQSPAFSESGRRLAYHRTVDGQCQIRLLTLDSGYNKLGEDSKVADCSVTTDHSSISWVSEDVLLYTDRAVKGKPMAIHQLDLNTTKTAPYLAISDSDYYGSGYYFITYDRVNQALFVLDAEDWSKTNIYRVGADKKIVLLKTVKDVLKTIALFDNMVVYKDLDNQFKSFLLDDPEDVENVYTNQLTAISHPHINSRHNKIAFVTGVYYQSRIHRYSIDSGNSSEVIASDSKLSLPKASSEEILVISGESGINQIYSYANNSRYQLSNFNVNYKIVEVSSSADNNWLAINFATGTTLYKRDHMGLSEVKKFPLLTFPDFSPDSENLLLSDRNNDGTTQSKVIEYGLSSYQQSGQIKPTGVVINNARFGVYHQDRIIYVPSDNKGLYSFSIGSNVAINENIIVASPNGFALSDSHAFVATRDHQFVSVDINSGLVRKLPQYLYNEFSISENSIYYISQSMGNMDIVVGDIEKSKIAYNNL